LCIGCGESGAGQDDARPTFSFWWPARCWVLGVRWPFEAGGNSTVLTLVDQLRYMGKPIYVLVDKDSKQNQPKIFNEAKLLQHGIPRDHIDYVGDRNELEELFSDHQWTVAANRFWPRNDGTDWEAAQINALRGSGKFSDRLAELLWRESHDKVSKPLLLARLAETLRHHDDVPAELIKAFERVTQTLRLNY
jgi:hypothetical protein